jgi:adenylate cyclase class 2
MQTEDEIEVKFPVSALAPLRLRLEQAGAGLHTPRHLERNWRLDTHSGTLTASRRVLRVRQADSATLTYKSATPQAMTRREIEVSVSSSEQAIKLLKALGYDVIFIYEKYREVFDVGRALIMLDDLPFGQFVEIEGPDQASLSHTAAQLGLNWAARVDLSYIELFNQLKHRSGADVTHSTFSDFKDLELPTLALLGLEDALTEPDETE